MENTKELWDNLWNENSKTHQELAFNLAHEASGTVWRQMKYKINENFKKTKKLSVVEIGAGAGFISALLAPMVKNVTTVDYSDAAIQKSKEFFSYLKIPNAQHINADALNIGQNLLGQFDIAMSFGLSEHFKNQDRERIIKSHFDMLRPGGLAFISVPNKHCLPYQIWKKKRELFNNWPFGLEIPFDRKEMSQICEKIGIGEYSFIGSSFIASWNFVLPFSRWSHSIKKRIFPDYFRRIPKIRPSFSTPLDSYLGYALVLVFRKADEKK